MDRFVWMALAATLGTWFLTALGAGLVVFFTAPNPKLMNALLGFAAGVMIAASFWSLLNPAIEGAEALVKADAAEHLAEESYGGIAAAEGIGDVGVHILLVHAEPVGGGAGILELLVIPAEGKVGNEGAGLVRALGDH